MPDDLTQSHHFRDGEHLHYFTAKSLEHILNQRGFLVERVGFEESALRVYRGKQNTRNILTVVARAVN